ncbi:MAG: MIP family channel protein [Candidatus Acidiferrales bacterium]
MFSTPQKLVAEFVGTFTLIFIGAGSICADHYLQASGQGGLGLLGIAAAHGLAIGLMVTAVGHVSGGHFNPAVTIAFWVTKKMGTIQSLLYWIAQLAGAVAAAYLLRYLIPDSVWTAVALGTPSLAPEFTRLPAILLEAAMTFLLVFVIFGVAADPKGAAKNVAGIAIGLTITMDILLGGPFTGAAMNPARAFGPALAIGHHWQNHGVYWVGPLIGGVLAGWLYNSLFLRES